MAEKTIYPLDKQFRFQNPATLFDTTTGKEYVLGEKGRFIIGRKDEDIPQSKRAVIEIVPYSGNGQGGTIDRKYEYMNPQHIKIEVEKKGVFYFHKVYVIKGANPIIIDNEVLTDEDDFVFLKPGSRISLPLVRIEVLDQQKQNF